MVAPFAYDARRHAYQRTGEYLFAQLIPYLGNKRRLLGLIDRAVRRTGVEQGVFADLFAGSGVVARYAKQRGFRVVANDWEPYSAVLCGAFIGANTPPCDPAVFDALNALPPLEGYITRHYCPADDDNPDPAQERLFYTRRNGGRIDAIRAQVAEWEAQGRITPRQKDYLLAPLIAAACYVSNTSGVFKAFHHGWGGRTGTALYRILSDLTLLPPPLCDNGQDNLVLRDDALALACSWQERVGSPPDVVYLDPPYNQHPYGSNYHLLNTIALGDCPPVPPVSEAKSAIRRDWRSERASPFNRASLALKALTDLVDAVPGRWVLISYSTDGNICLTDLLTACSARGALSVETCRYKRYRVSAQRMSAQPRNTEFVLILDRHGRADPDDGIRCSQQIAAQEDD